MSLSKLVLSFFIGVVAFISMAAAQDDKAANEEALKYGRKMMVGKWKFNQKKSLAAAKKNGLEKLHGGPLRKLPDGVVFEFRKDGTCILQKNTAHEFKGKWKAIGDDKYVVVVFPGKPPGGHGRRQRKLHIKILSEHERFIDGVGRNSASVVLDRVREEKKGK